MKFSIITPVYNREDCISRCIESTLKQVDRCNTWGVEIEHIIVNDGSSDLTDKICKGYANNNAYIKYMSFTENRGTNAARNAAISAATGEWCVLLDSDDYFTDDALSIIAQTMRASYGYKHYMFAADDMLAYYNTNIILKGCHEKVLLYPDFLNGYIGGDFIHVCSTDVLRRHPFDEQIRTYEGLYFLLFFREVQQMFFTNKVVTIRERNRRDSVSKDFLRTNSALICRDAKYCKLMLEYFEDDFIRLGMSRRQNSIRLRLAEDYILLYLYNDADSVLKHIGRGNSKNKWKIFVLQTVGLFHIGWLYRKMLEGYLFMKYKVVMAKLN